jgi:hypothetical protein
MSCQLVDQVEILPRRPLTARLESSMVEHDARPTISVRVSRSSAFGALRVSQHIPRRESRWLQEP